MRHKLKAMLDPSVRHSLGVDLDRPKDVFRDVGLERGREDAAVLALDSERSGVRLLLDIYAPVPIIIKPGGPLGLAGPDLHRRRQGI